MTSPTTILTTHGDDRSYDYVGTPVYSAPEQFVSPELVGPPADIFSLGVVLYKALTLQYPYPYGNNPKHYNGKLPPLDQSDIPTLLYQILREMLYQDPEQRTNALQIKEQLQACYSTLIEDNRDG